VVLCYVCNGQSGGANDKLTRIEIPGGSANTTSTAQGNHLGDKIAE
jgi:hypothetical protein